MFTHFGCRFFQFLMLNCQIILYVVSLSFTHLSIISKMSSLFSLLFQRAEQVTLGLGLYPTVSLLNHSCNPAMELVFYGNSCIVRAIRNVEEDILVYE